MGTQGRLEQGGGGRSPEEGAWGGSEEREAGRAALGACTGARVTWQRDCVSHPELRADAEPWEPHLGTGKSMMEPSFPTEVL